MVKVFVYDLLRPWNPVWETEAEIRTNKQSWAILPNGKRKLLGSSAFFTEGSAKRSRLGLLLKISKDSYLRQWQQHYWNYCKEALERDQPAVGKKVPNRGIRDKGNRPQRSA
jgi:hypothetical protein